MNQIKSSNEVTLTDLRRLGFQGGATARLESGEEVLLTDKYGLIERKGYIAGQLQKVMTVAEYPRIYKDIRTIKRDDVLVARRIKRGNGSILQLTGKGYNRTKS
ncbi:hypothetical protein STRDD10_00426 [Streptococcus sp. DD10]|uniref:hypothetical protein n=1 Tax=Streptococcus sp. DD10 TaxID=1777878 RepID=UPI000792DB7B|nr:hypothetical protein [Streptococcus sp. DD10]KXT75152.1 hypothetical protein STRDD10_00426 [Streptococcus sp. DD10]